MLILQSNFQLRSVGHYSSFVRLLVFFKWLSVHKVEHLVSRPSPPIHGSDGVNEEFENILHVLLGPYYQIKISVSNIDCQALPAVKRSRIHFLNTCRIEMFPKHPESAVQSPKTDALDVINIERGATGTVPKFRILVLLLRWVMDLFLLKFVNLLILLFSLRFNFEFVCLQNEFSMVHGLPIRNFQNLAISWKLYKRLKTDVVLCFRI